MQSLEISEAGIAPWMRIASPPLPPPPPPTITHSNIVVATAWNWWACFLSLSGTLQRWAEAKRPLVTVSVQFDCAPAIIAGQLRRGRGVNLRWADWELRSWDADACWTQIGYDGRLLKWEIESRTAATMTGCCSLATTWRLPPAPTPPWLHSSVLVMLG